MAIVLVALESSKGNSLGETVIAEIFVAVTVVADDSYRAELLVEEVKEENRAYLMLEDNTLRLIVFKDENSKRSVSDVVEICVE